MEVLAFTAFAVVGALGLLRRRRVTEAVLTAEDRYGTSGSATPERRRHAARFVDAGCVLLIGMAVAGLLLTR